MEKIQFHILAVSVLDTTIHLVMALVEYLHIHSN